ncbi:uncharacterized protein cubi_03248 [Cryptosporidium ubiquitum]|uniref:Uncharacterized protein n=1 Tax=Cryptosporidium ubiquitum TaxID=857276 RepID=A0A1J4M9Q9_9CRYT|nr:uncharacterized protein cubi_03248 [Cryptosporidium ubiquitum]OII70950.1 hypothetical protein cubi_03248 [Cryptosporidium ubiquitum]
MSIIDDQSFDPNTSEMALMEVMAKSLHHVFETFQYEASTLRNKSDQAISKSLEQYVSSLKNVFSESFSNLSTYIGNPGELQESMDMFFFSAYIFELFYVVFYSSEEELTDSLFKWYLKYGMRDSVSQLVGQLTEASDNFLDFQESGKVSEARHAEERLGKLLTRALLLGEIELFNSSIWSLFPNDKFILSLSNLLSHHSKELPPISRSLSKELQLLKNNLPTVVQTSLEGLFGNGSVIQDCSDSWLEAFVFSSKYVSGISLDNFPQFLSIYLDCLSQDTSPVPGINSSVARSSQNKRSSILRKAPQDMLEHELGALYLLSRDLSKFIVHLYESSELYGPFLAAHLFDPLFYEGFLEEVPLELKSKNLRSRVLMNYTLWLVETDLCDPAIYLQECSDSPDLKEDILRALTLISNKIPLLFEYVSDNLETEAENIFLNNGESNDPKCEQCFLNEYIPDWNMDESISVFFKLIREFIPQIVPLKDQQIDFSRKLIVERFNQATLELQKSFESKTSLKQHLLLLEKVILLLELARIENTNQVISMWIILEHYVNVPPTLFLNIIAEKGDIYSQYNFQEKLPEEYMLDLDLTKDVSLEKQLVLITEFYPQRGILETISQLIPEFSGQGSNLKIPPFFKTMIEFSQHINSIFWTLLSPSWNPEKQLWETESNINKDTLSKLSCLKQPCQDCCPDQLSSDDEMLDSAAKMILSANPNAIPQILIPLYCLYCQKLLEGHISGSIQNLDVISRISSSWMDIFLAHAISDTHHPFINNPDLNSTIIAKVSDIVNKSFL